MRFFILKYGYCRVSTNGQFTHGVSMEAQEESVKNAGAEIIFKDVFTGSKTNRPEFQKLLKLLKKGDTLIVTKLDRFARSTLEGTKLIQELFEKEITINILNLGIIENTPNGRLIFNVFMSFAEFERDMIVERTQEGKAIAKMREGFKEGRPKKFTKKQLDHAMGLKENGMSYKEVSDVTGISKSTLTREYSKRKK